MELFEPAKVLKQYNLETALALAAGGAAVFPCHSEGEKVKAPGQNVFWLSMSSSAETKVREMWSRWPRSMPGVDCGKTGWLVVDCDVKRSNGIEWFLNYAAECGQSLDDVPYVETPSGGRHYIFKNPDGIGCVRGALPGKDIADIDIKGKGGYVIGAGAVMTNGMGGYSENGDVFDAPAVPGWLLDLLSPPKAMESAPIIARVDPAKLDMERLEAYGQEALAQEFSNLASKQPGERNTEANLIAFRMGQLVGGGALSFDDACNQLESAALAWGIRPNDKALGARGTIRRALKDGMRAPRGPKNDLGPTRTVEILLDGTAIDCTTGEILEPPQPIDPRELPDHLTQIPGLVGDITDWICDTAIRPQRGLALGAALAIVGTAAGRHLSGPTRSGTHLYIVGLAPSGAGKDHPLSMIAPILAAADMRPHIGPSQFISMPAVIRFLQRSPLSVCAMDEFGSFLKRINNRRASGFEGAISGLLRTAWGCSFKAMATPEWAQQSSSTIFSPAMSIFGVSTAREFYDSLEGGDVTNGVLNRFLVIETHKRPPEQVPKGDPSRVPDDIVQALKAIYNRNPLVAAQLCQSQQSPAYDVLGISPDAEQIRLGLSKETEARGDADRMLEPFLARTAENAIRIATIAAIGQGAREIDAKTMHWAREFSVWSSNRLADGAGLYIADSDTQAAANAIRRAIQERGGRVSRSSLVRALQHKYKSREMDDVIKLLAEAEQIIIEDVVAKDKNGRPARFYALPST